MTWVTEAEGLPPVGTGMHPLEPADLEEVEVAMEEEEEEEEELLVDMEVEEVVSLEAEAEAEADTEEEEEEGWPTRETSMRGTAASTTTT